MRRVSLSGRVCLVTGATGGIGRATAYALVRRDARVVATGRDEKRLRSLERAGISTLKGDLAVYGTSAQIAAEALRLHGGVDVLVNCAGIGLCGPLAALEKAELERAVQVNLTAPIALTRELVPQMLERRWGHIVNIGSIVGHVGRREESVYAATKAALAVFSESLRAELYGSGVEVSLVSPGIVSTEFFGRRGVPSGRYHPRPIEPERVAEVIVEAIERGRKDVLVPAWLTVPVRLKAVAPGLYRALARRFD